MSPDVAERLSRTLSKANPGKARAARQGRALPDGVTAMIDRPQPPAGLRPLSVMIVDDKIEIEHAGETFFASSTMPTVS
jgi:hypothetical protein